jgi:hypothetical protein
VPPEVELEGLDLAEYETLIQPEHGIVLEQIVEPDGTLVEASAIYRAETNGSGEIPTLRR